MAIPPMYNPLIVETRPNLDLATAKYRRHAGGYDAGARRTEFLRRRAIDALDLRAGDAVVDVGCGTGLSFGLIEDRIGPRGVLIGVEPCPEMLALARERVRARGWANVVLVESSAERATFPGPADAFLFNFTHDVLRSRPALDHLFAAAKNGAGIAASGMKFFPWWLAPANPLVRIMARPYLTTFDGFSKPWSLLEDYAGSLEVSGLWGGMLYLARGTCRGRLAP